MDKEKLKIKYPDSVEMIDSLEKKKIYSIRGDKTVHSAEDGTYYYNYQGNHIREFKNLEHLIKWFYGSPEEESKAEAKIKNFGYSEYLSNLKDAEVWLDEKFNVSSKYCDFTNSDFKKTDLKIAQFED